MVAVYLNRIATAVPENDIHRKFVDSAPLMLGGERTRALFNRMASRSRIEHRYSFLKPISDTKQIDGEGFYTFGSFPDTKTRMQYYERHAFSLAQKTLDKLGLPGITDGITHLIVTSCTGFYAPGLDLQIVQHYGLKASTERTVIGFMGCNAALNALKLAHHIVRSEATANVLVVNLELCTLHLKETQDLEQLLSFLIFADGCAAGLVSAEPSGLELQRFGSTILADSGEQITWRVGESGFDMFLSGQIPASIANGLPPHLCSIVDGRPVEEIKHWAVHPGGRTIVDSVQKTLGLSGDSLISSRKILRLFGNMSSATIMFVLQDMMQRGGLFGSGCALAFGPGVTIESMLFQLAGTGG
ncbi:MAG: type III polyketide synthase [Nitrospirae bacterium]|nr:type III polyketide synthase [Nitrospirota bacterium]